MPRKVPNSYHYFEENGSCVDLPFLKGSDVLRYLLSAYPSVLMGGFNPGPQVQTLFKTFWKLYRVEHPTHQIFQLADQGVVDLSFTIPLVIHGDGARTLKKQPLEVISLHPILGLDTGKTGDKFKCKCCSGEVEYVSGDPTHPFSQRLNCRHHSYLTHFLLCAFPSKKYKKLPGLLLSVLETISEDLGPLTADGIMHNGCVYHFGFLGMVGDLEYHAKTGLLSRSYQNVGHRNFIPCCHLCAAGGPLHPFEDLTSSAAWKGTVYHSAPWSSMPPFHHIVFEDWSTGLAARWFLLDTFHLFRLGIARNFIASAVFLLCFDCMFDYNDVGESRAVDARLGRAWASFHLWCDTARVSPSGIRGFTKEKLHYPTASSFPWVGCKGSDSMYLLRWLEWFTSLQLVHSARTQSLILVNNACKAGLDFQSIHRHGIWLQRSCGRTLEANCRGFLHAYARLAKHSLDRGLTLFSMVPKVHGTAHIYHRLQICSKDRFRCNPALWDCSMSEDFVGRVARQSRRVGHRHVVENTLHAYKVKGKLELDRLKRKRAFDQVE